SLVRAARRAADEEVRHARAMTRWAHSAGGRPEVPVVAAAPVRSLEEMLAENARAGCVREPFGAVLAAYQARAAHDPEARATLDAIARDEKSHAELSWRVAQWGESKLDDV